MRTQNHIITEIKIQFKLIFVIQETSDEQPQRMIPLFCVILSNSWMKEKVKQKLKKENENE